MSYHKPYFPPRGQSAGDKEKAKKCYAKSQYWLNRYNKLTGRA